MKLDDELALIRDLSILKTLSSVFLKYAYNLPELDKDILNGFVLINDYIKKVDEDLARYLE